MTFPVSVGGEACRAHVHLTCTGVFFVGGPRRALPLARYVSSGVLWYSKAERAM